MQCFIIHSALVGCIEYSKFHPVAIAQHNMGVLDSFHMWHFGCTTKFILHDNPIATTTLYIPSS